GCAALDRALAVLPDGYRAVLVLRDVDGLSNEEAADALGESVSSVKSRLHRARMALREIITRSLAPKYAPAMPRARVSRPAWILDGGRRVKSDVNQSATAIILAGGDGTRLRELTRRIAGDDRPKQFCRVLGSQTLLDQTRQRVAQVIAPARTFFSVTL